MCIICLILRVLITDRLPDPVHVSPVCQSLSVTVLSIILKDEDIIIKHCYIGLLHTIDILVSQCYNDVEALKGGGIKRMSTAEVKRGFNALEFAKAAIDENAQLRADIARFQANEARYQADVARFQANEARYQADIAQLQARITSLETQVRRQNSGQP